jgi:DNA-binding MarR family transcriptional regulator
MSERLKIRSKPKVKRFDSPEQEAYLSVWRTYDRLRGFDESVFMEWDLTAQQYNVLRLLRAASPDSVPTLVLANRLISRAPDITRMIDRLEARGWVVRTRSESDRRTILVSITEAGIGLLAKLADPLAECHRKQLGHLSVSELKQLVELLKKVRLPHEPNDSLWK